MQTFVGASNIERIYCAIVALQPNIEESNQINVGRNHCKHHDGHARKARKFSEAFKKLNSGFINWVSTPSTRTTPQDNKTSQSIHSPSHVLADQDYLPVEDNKAAVTYLTRLNGKVDPERIGVLGICASGGYSSQAAQSDTRIKALATVSAACVGRMTRNGGLYEANNKESPEAIAGALKAAGDWRTAHANDPKAQAPRMFEAEPSAVPEEEASSFFKAAAAYYGSPRGRHVRSDQRVPPSSYDLMIGYDSFRLQHLISPRPLLMIAGAEAETLHFSKEAVEGGKGAKRAVCYSGANAL